MSLLGLKEKTEKLVKKKMEVKEQLTPWEEYLQKKKDKKIEKRKAKQVGLGLKKHFSSFCGIISEGLWAYRC